MNQTQSQPEELRNIDPKAAAPELDIRSFPYFNKARLIPAFGFIILVLALMSIVTQPSSTSNLSGNERTDLRIGLTIAAFVAPLLKMGTYDIWYIHRIRKTGLALTRTRLYRRLNVLNPYNKELERYNVTFVLDIGFIGTALVIFMLYVIVMAILSGMIFSAIA